MIRREHLIGQALSAALVMSGVAVFTLGHVCQTKAQQSTRSVHPQIDPAATFKSNARQQPTPSPAPRREESKRPPDPTKYSYEFTQPQFDICRILIEHDAAGRGKVTFERQGEESGVVEP